MVLLEYLYSQSVVRLCEEITMHAGFRWCCRLLYGATEPNRRGLVKQRKRWAEAGVFEKILRKVAQQCIDAGLVEGSRLPLIVRMSLQMPPTGRWLRWSRLDR